MLQIKCSILNYIHVSYWFIYTPQLILNKLIKCILNKLPIVAHDILVYKLNRLHKVKKILM